MDEEQGYFVPGTIESALKKDRAMKNTWSYGATLKDFLSTKQGASEADCVNAICGEINNNSNSFCILETQREAWRYEVELLRKVLAPYNKTSNKIYFEFDLMRFSKRVDVVLVLNGILICLEFKTDLLSGEKVKSYNSQDKTQALEYADEFSQFHSTSRECPIVPVLVVPAAPDKDDPVEKCCDNIYEVIRANESNLQRVIEKICKKILTNDKDNLIADINEWERGEYETVPTIVQAAGRLFENQDVEAITRSGTDITATMEALDKIIRKAEADKECVLCFVTGEPGAGKTLVGLKIAAQQMERISQVEGKDKLIRKVLLSGNYPLVKVLKESLIRNFTEKLQACKDKVNKEGGVLTKGELDLIARCGFEMKPTGKTKKIEVAGKNKVVNLCELYTIDKFNDKGKRSSEIKGANADDFTSRKFSKCFISSTVSSMIQLVSHFRRGWETSEKAPSENVFVFDEAQRAWSADQVRAKDKKTHPEQIKNGWSEPRTLLEYLNRHASDDWCVAVALVGVGQDIHAGEAGISEWYKAMSASSFNGWKICVAPATRESDGFKEYFASDNRVNPEWKVDYSRLHLNETMRSYAAKGVGPFVNAIVEGRSKIVEAKKGLGEMTKFPLYLTRDIELARKWVLNKSLNGERRCGIVMSSRALRLRKYGFITQGMGFDEVSWFLDDMTNINSSCAMELAASEFKVQGLELDYVLMGWDGDFSFDPKKGVFECRHFSKRENKWKSVVKISKDDDAGDVNGDKEPEDFDPRNRERHLRNAYRVLLTRARQGMIIFIPEGENDEESNMWKGNYDATYSFLCNEVGIPELTSGSV